MKPAELGIYRLVHMNFIANTKAAGQSHSYPKELADVIKAKDGVMVKNRIAQWPGYEPTPLRHLTKLNDAIGVGDILYKDESSRFGLKSFKALGGAFAVEELLIEKLSHRLGRDVSIEEARRNDFQDYCRDITVTTATDGNHGRSVAWGAARYGCRSIIYVHEGVSKGRKAALRALGAEVRTVAGNYDDSVRQAAADARVNGWFIVSDTSYDGYVKTPRNVMRGYTAMMQEIAEQLGPGSPPTHVFIQGGVGGLAAAVIGYFWDWLGPDRPQFVIVEPIVADCLYQSVAAGAPMTVSGAHDSMMAGLCCGEVSMLAWPFIQDGAQYLIAIPDDTIPQTMRFLANGDFSDISIEAGESAVGGVSALISAALKPQLRRALALDSNSRILLFGTEGATDPEIYKAILAGKYAPTA